VTEVDGRPLGNGAPGILTSRIVKDYWAKREAGWHGTPVADLLGELEVA
jgi:branched-chain amino acid aminotransferase